MKKILKTLWLLAFSGLLLAFVFACASAFLSPKIFLFSNIFAIAFPYLFVVAFVASLIHAFNFKKGWIFLLLIIFLSSFNISHLIGFNKKENFSMQKNEKHLRILTWNVEMFTSSKISESNFADKLSNPFSAYTSLIQNYNSDIVCFQEYFDSNILDSALFKMGFLHKKYMLDSIFENNKWNSRDFGVAIFSKFPMENIRNIPFKTNNLRSDMLTADVQTPQGKINVNTFHLFSFRISKSREELQEKSNLIYTIKRLAKVSKDQTNQLITYKKVIDANENPIIICGDFNNVPTSFIYNKAKRGLQDTYLRGANGYGITFPNFLRTLRIDYILADKKFTVKQTKIIEENISDHYSLITDISL